LTLDWFEGVDDGFRKGETHPLFEGGDLDGSKRDDEPIQCF
jgi:hypothetical protein